LIVGGLKMKEKLINVLMEYIEQGTDPVTKENELWEEFGEKHAVVVIDSSGFTRTTNKFGIIYFLSKLAQVRKLTIPIVEQHQCERYIMDADNFIGLFPTVQHAFDAVIEINVAITLQQIMLDDNDPFKISAGIGYGKLLVAGGHGEFFGAEINIASKLGEDVAAGGDIMLTQKAFAALNKKDRIRLKERQVQASGNDILCYTMSV